MTNDTNWKPGILLPGIFLVFLTLKLIGVLKWSWWWITSPLWLPFCAIIGFFTIVGIIHLLIIVIEHRRNRNEL